MTKMITLQDGFDFEADTDQELMEQLIRYKEYELGRISEINDIQNEMRDYKNLPTLDDEQFYAINDLLSKYTGYCVAGANLTNDTLTVQFDLECDEDTVIPFDDPRNLSPQFNTQMI